MKSRTWLHVDFLYHSNTNPPPPPPPVTLRLTSLGFCLALSLALRLTSVHTPSSSGALDDSIGMVYWEKCPAGPPLVVRPLRGVASGRCSRSPWSAASPRTGWGEVGADSGGDRDNVCVCMTRLTQH